MTDAFKTVVDPADVTGTVTKDETAVIGRGGALKINTTTKADLLSRAKDEIATGDQSLHAAAEALDVAQKEFKATQREIAQAIGKSVAWVNRLLRWRSDGCSGTPFGPGSKAVRERKKTVQST